MALLVSDRFLICRVLSRRPAIAISDANRQITGIATITVPRWRIGRSVHANWRQRSSKYFTDIEGESLLPVYRFLAIYAMGKFVFFIGYPWRLTVETRLDSCASYLLT